MTLSLLQTLKPYIEAAKISDLRIEEDATTGSITLDGVTIELEERAVTTIRVRGFQTSSTGSRFVSFFIVSFAVPVSAGRESPPDVDVIDVGAYQQAGKAVRVALGVVLDQRLLRYENQLADAEAAQAFLDEQG